MKRVWKVVAMIIAIAIILGCVCLAVGVFTGAEYDRILSVLDARYHIVMYWEWVLESVDALAAQI